MPRESVELAFSPLTPDRWGDFETLFGERGACGGCWCMLWRRERKDFEAGKGTGNKAAMRGVVDAEIPGILAYAEGAPVGWCAVAPPGAGAGLRAQAGGSAGAGVSRGRWDRG